MKSDLQLLHEKFAGEPDWLAFECGSTAEACLEILQRWRREIPLTEKYRRALDRTMAEKREWVTRMTCGCGGRIQHDGDPGGQKFKCDKCDRTVSATEIYSNV